jgi:hypothetical protein
MKMRRVMMFRYVLALVPLVLVGTSCSDDDEQKSKTDMLTQKSWKVSKAEMKTTTGTFDISAGYIEDCEKDNLVAYSRDGKFSSQTGADDCDGVDENVAGTWSWKESETVLSVTLDGDVEEVKLVELTESTLKVNVGSIPYDQNGDGIDDSEVELLYTFTTN